MQRFRLPLPLPRSLTIAALVVTTGIAVPGCGSNELETGYRIRPLKASRAEQRAFYAGPFSPEARAAQVESFQSDEARRRRPGQ
ncbi:MAG: hypothetical protein AAF743_13515 [Planctomycetota bacterium]